MLKWILTCDETTVLNANKIVAIELFRHEVRAYLDPNDPDNYYVIYEGTEDGDTDDFYKRLLKKLDILR